jgi:hypothetical protein
MQTRAAASRNKAVRVVDVLLHNLGTDEIELIGKATDYSEAIALAHRSGKVPKGWNVAGMEKNEERIIVPCKKGKIIAGDGVVTAVTPPKPKAKKALVLPEKLEGMPKNQDAAFAPRKPIPEVPGILNVTILPTTFMTCVPRAIDSVVGSWEIKVEILREQTRNIRVRKDVFGLELLALAFEGIDLSPDDRVRIVVKPRKLEDGDTYTIERVVSVSRLALIVHTWNGGIRRCGIEISPMASKEEFIRETGRRLPDMKMEKPDVYTILHK